MVNSRSITFLSMLAILVLATNLFFEQEENREPPPPSNEPDMYMRNATIVQYDDTGSLQQRMKASRFTHYPLTDTLTLLAPELHMVSDPANAPWDINADHGRLLTKTRFREQALDLWDNVVARQDNADGSFIEISSVSMTVYPERDYAESDQPVTIAESTGVTRAAGLQAYLDRSTFVLYSSPTRRVTTVLEPGTIPAPD